jgi:enamine deaminase RidA (YjgF/YER057c/UK114 family)
MGEHVSRPLNPAHWPRPQGYANGVAASCTQVFVAGQIGWDETETLVEGGLVAQTRQALANCLAVLAEAGGRPEHATRMTWLVADLDAYRAARPEIGEVYRELMGAVYPAMSLYQVGLLEPGALIEIELTAVIPA